MATFDVIRSQKEEIQISIGNLLIIVLMVLKQVEPINQTFIQGSFTHEFMRHAERLMDRLKGKKRSKNF